MAGATAFVEEVVVGHIACPNQFYVLSGYSQGAAALHIALLRLEEDYPALLNKIAAVVMLSDPLRQPGTENYTYGGDDFAEGIMTAHGYLAEYSSPIPAELSARTFDYCKPMDPICHLGIISPTAHTSPSYKRQYPNQASDHVTDVLAEVPGLRRQYDGQTVVFGSLLSGDDPYSNQVVLVNLRLSPQGMIPVLQSDDRTRNFEVVLDPGGYGHLIQDGVARYAEDGTTTYEILARVSSPQYGFLEHIWVHVDSGI